MVLAAQLQVAISNATMQFREPVKQVEAQEFVNKPLIVETVITKKETPQLSRTLTTDSVQIIGESNLQCVEYYKQRAGISRSLGYAGRIKSQGDTPVVGAGALWKGVGHIGYVVAVFDNYLIVEDANWYKGKITRHILPYDSFRGFIY